MFLPKSLVHTAMRTSSSEQGLQVTKRESVEKENVQYPNVRKRKWSFSPPRGFILRSASCSLFFSLGWVFGTSKEIERTWMRRAGEGADVITELPLDPVSYKNNYKTPPDADTHTPRSGQAFFCLIRRAVQPSSSPSVCPSTGPLYLYGWAKQNCPH